MSDVQAGSEADTTTSNVLRLGAAKLVGVNGEGIIRVRRDLNGAVFEVLGTWRLASDATLPALLRRAQDEGTPVTYDGPLDDPGEPTRQNISVQVRLDGIHHFQRDVHQPGRGFARARHDAPANDGAVAMTSGEAVVIIHLALDVKALPYKAAVAERGSAAAVVATHARSSRQAVPVLASVRGRGLPPLDATLDGILGGSWQPAEDGDFLWYSTPAESHMAFAVLYDAAQHLVGSGPVDLELWPADAVTTESLSAPRASNDREAAKSRSATAGIGSSPPVPRKPAASSRHVVITDVGRSPDANYIVAKGTSA